MLTLLSLALAVTLKSTVPASGDLTCNAYVHYPDNTRGELPFILSQDNSGNTTKSRATDLDPTSAYLRRTGKAAVVVFDKPGIQADPTLPAGFRVDQAVVDRVTDDDLVACAANAMTWAMTQPSSSLAKGLGIFGRGDGSVIAARAYARALKTNLTWMKSIRLLELVSPGSIRPALDILADLKAPATIEIYQGLDDSTTSGIMDLEAQPPLLPLNVRYYHAGPALNTTAVNDQLFAWLAYFL